jgi:RNA polymerase sigma factor (TIGR02999 family)
MAERITELLHGWANEDAGARDRLVPLVYEELRRIAHCHMKDERRDHTLQTTGLVNEMFMRMFDVQHVAWRDRQHFISMASTVMRRVLVDYARHRARDKRGGGVLLTTLGDNDVAEARMTVVDVLALDQALDRLAALDPQQAKVVECRFFGGLTVEETADALDIAPITVKREWAMAKAWLHQQLTS